jgi:hypothetical protein
MTDLDALFNADANIAGTFAHRVRVLLFAARETCDAWRAAASTVTNTAIAITRAAEAVEAAAKRETP